MVKSRHNIETIAVRIRTETSSHVRLEHVVGEAVPRTQIGPRRNGADRPQDTQGPIDPVAAAARGWESPLEFPPLSAATVPGDRVAIAVDADVPQAADIVRGTVESLQRAGIEPGAISIVTTSEALSQRCRDALAGNGTSDVSYVVHDPTDEQNLCLLGATRHGALMTNRTIFDADLVLPIGVARVNDYGAFDGLFPQFTDNDTLERFRVPEPLETEEQHKARARETSEAGWLIGAPLVMRIVPGPGETVAHVLAGDPNVVAERSHELCRREWAWTAERRASLVIATITGGAEAQTWPNVARALAAAERLVDEGGAVAVCSNIDQPPGKSLGRLIGADDMERTEQRVLQDHAEDSWAAWELARARERGPVYFLSQLDPETVEDMGLAPVANIDEIVRLAGRHESCVVLDDSQHAHPTVSGE